MAFTGVLHRSFDHANKKDTLFFELAEGFVKGSQEIEVSITYRDADAGQWALEYLATDGSIKTAKTVSNTQSGEVWKTTDPIRISDAQLNHCRAKSIRYYAGEQRGYRLPISHD